MNPKQRGHVAYLFRLWRVDNGVEAIQRASLQDAHTGERLGFASLDEAMAYLRQQLESLSDPRHPDRDPDAVTQ